ncbi:uncharacterized protein LOC133375581 [Rhineura floridana]|uniref:uncharacterized protein LOC133375581 n=1 Tax=Rhineura floridana TaxID=261503 RepID=UPI002AC855E7|nr:uncharacterized protein LOC133375581 [Rhineura floridana]
MLKRLRENHLYAKLEKCGFDLKSLDFLGYRISAEGVEMDPGKVSCILDWGQPVTKKDVQRFLGFANYYRKFIPGFSKLTAPLTDCLRGKKKFQWTENATEAFEELKRRFATEPILRFADPNCPFVVEADTSDFAIGGVLLQIDQEGKELRIGTLIICLIIKREFDWDVGRPDIRGHPTSLDWQTIEHPL